MHKKAIIYFILVSISQLLVAQNEAITTKWSYNTSYLMPAGKWESGIFQPLRYGLNEKIELNTHVFMLPLIPEAAVKINLGDAKGISIASEHSISSPTPFLNLISRKGTGGILSPEFDFPFILSLSNGMVVSKPLCANLLLSAHVKYTFALRGSKPDYQATIDLPLFYPRMAHYYKGSTINTGLALKGTLSSKWLYEQSVQVFAITRNDNNFFFENSGSLMWAAGLTLRIKGGYVLTYGNFPFDNHWQMWPTIDLVFGKR